MVTPDENPARLADYDPKWASDAAVRLEEIRVVLADLPGSSEARYDHIGSTAVPGLAAKPYLDLQVRILPSPTHADLTQRLTPIGFERSAGSRPGSPGVTRDTPRGRVDVPDDVWEKRLYFDRDRGVILHVRRSDSPWADYTVWFRDWLREHPAERQRYEARKRQLSEQNAGSPDYDDYTRAKTAYFDEVQRRFTDWATGTQRG